MDKRRPSSRSTEISGPDRSPSVKYESMGEIRVEMSQEEIDAIIRNKRKVRDPKACYACHRRKVKCDRNLPCDSCVKRDHPELCSYERPTKKRRIALPGQAADGVADTQDVVLHDGPNITIPKERWDKLNQELKMLRESVRSHAEDQDNDSMDAELDDAPALESRSEEGDRQGIHAPSSQMGTMHLGSQSVLAYMSGLGRSKSSLDAAQTLLVEDVLPKLGLDNETSTYPFVDLWSSESSIHNVNGLCGTMPDDNLCREFFVAYRDIAYTIYPVIPDISLFETNLNFMLANRARIVQEAREIEPTKPYGVSLQWLSLAFAVFASGSQASTRPAKERELTSQVYICSSYHALRMSNFLIHPCLETIQASLIIANALSHNMNPGVAYIFLGMTLRMAFSIGLQINSHNFSDHELWTRRRVWWALAWQDSHFAVSYDRPTSSVVCVTEIPYTRHSSPGHRSYAESMFAIIQLTQEIIRERMLHSRNSMSWTQIQRYTQEIATIRAAAAPHLRDKRLCALTARHLERLALKVHSSYVTSELCRPALKEANSAMSNTSDGQSPTAANAPHSPSGRRRKSSHASGHSPASTTSDPMLVAHLRKECIRSLEDTISAYVEMNSYSECAARSWIGIQRSMSAAFLLATIPDALTEPRVRDLLQDLQSLISKRSTEDPSYEFISYMDGHSSPGTSRKLSTSRGQGEEAPHWARSMSKSLKALEKLNAALASPFPPKQQNSKYSQNTTLPSISTMAAYARPGSSITSITSITSPSIISPPPIYTNGTAIKQESFPSPSGFYINPYLNNSTGNNSPNPSLGQFGTGTSGNVVLGSFTPDSSTSDWNQANMIERALEFVQPALWS